MMKKKQVVRRMGGGAMKKQVAKRMGGGAMKKQVVKKRGGGTMTPVAMNKGGSLSPGKLKAMTGETTKGKALMKLARQIKPTGRINTDDLERIRKMLNKKK